MDYAGYVGPVGALAVALGIGAAVSASPVAWADDETSTSTSSTSATSSASESSSSTADPASNEPGSDADSPAGESTTSAHDLDTADDSVADDPDAADDSTPEVDGDGEPTTVETSTGDVPSDEAGLEVAGDAAPATAPDRVSHGGSARTETDAVEPTPDRRPAESDTAAAADVDVPATTRYGRSVAAAEPSAPEPVVAETPTVDVVSTAALASVVAPVTRSVPSFPEAVIQIVRDVVGALLSPFANPIPTTPDSSPLLLMVEWFRRTTIGAFYNRGPDVSPMQIGENADGLVIGTLGATDPDGDPLSYNVSQGPARGSVVVDAHGTFAYTPNVDLARDGGTDTFTVNVSDGGLRLLSQRGITTVTVSVAVGAGDALGINGTPFAVAMSPDGSWAYVTDAANNRVSVVDVATQSVIGAIPVGAGPSGIAVAKDGRVYVVNGADATVTVFDRTRVVRPYVYVGSAPTGIAVNDAGTRVVVANSNEDSVSVIDTQSWDVTRVEVGAGPYGVAFSGNRALITNEYDDNVSVLDLDTNTVVATISVGDAPTGIAISGNRAVVTNAGSMTTPGDGSVSIIDLDTLSVLGSPIAVGDSPASVVIDAAGTRAYIADVERSTISVLDIAGGVLTGETYGVAAGPTGLTLGADGRLYVAGFLGGTIDPVDVDAPVTVADTASVQATAAIIREMDLTKLLPFNPGGSTGQGWASTTKGFDIYNDTAQNLTLIAYGNDNRPNGGGPVEGTVLAVGAHMHLEIPADTFGVAPVVMLLSTPAGEVWSVKMLANANFFYPTGILEVQHFDGTGTSDPLPGDVPWYTWSTETTVRILDAPKTTITVAADDPSSVALLSACASDSRAACTFEPTSEPTQSWTEWFPVLASDGSQAVYIHGPGGHDLGGFYFHHTAVGKLVDQPGLKDSLTLALSSKTTIKAPAGQRLSSTRTFDAWTPAYEVPYQQALRVQFRAPLLRYTGNMKITIGNSTATVTGVRYDVPDPVRWLDFAETITPVVKV